MDWNQIMDVKIRSSQYHSKMSQLIQSFINQKRNSGYPYNSSAQILSCFDKMLVDNFPEATTITPEIINAWVNYKPKQFTPKDIAYKATFKIYIRTRH